MSKIMAICLLGATAHANTLTSLIPTMYQNIDIVSRELVGFIPSVTRNANAERAAVNQSILVPLSPIMAGGDITPAMAVPEPTDRTVDNVEIKITKSRFVSFGYTGEEQLGLNNGPGSSPIFSDFFQQALRTLTNEMEADLATEARNNVSRAYGTPTTALFATNTGETAQLKKILDDSGAPGSDRGLILGTTEGAALRTLGQLTKVNESGTIMTLRDGLLLDLNGFAIKESAQIVGAFTKGTNNGSASTNNAGYAVGATTITLASAGTGTILANDLITFAGDTNKYQVVTGDADVSNGGTVVIAAPGLRVAIAASNTVITTVGSTTTRAIGFHRQAIQLVTRAPALPNGDDLAVDSFLLTDPRSGITFEVRVYPGYRKVRIEVAAAWGVKAIKPAHIGALIA